MIAAVNEAIRKSQEMMTEEMKKITGGSISPAYFEEGSRWNGPLCKAH